MKLYYMRQEVLEDLKNNANNNVNLYLEESNDWITKSFEEPFLEYKKTAPDFELMIDNKELGFSDYNNIKILHSNLKFLSKTEASDERFWAGLSHSVFWDFMNKRWSKTPVKNSRDIENRYFLSSVLNHRRALFTNTLSKYWWIGELICDSKNANNPYYLLDAFSNNFLESLYTFFSSNYTSNPKTVRAVLKAILNYQKENGKLSKVEYQGVLRYANLIGGSYLLDYLDEEEIEEKINAYIHKVILNNESIDEAIEEETKEPKGLYSKFKMLFRT